VDKVLVTILLIIGGIVCCMVVINAVFPAITQSAGAIADASSKIDDRIRCQVQIIEVSDSGNDVYVWIKNIGASRIGGVNTGDIFFGPEGNFARIPYDATAASKPCWNYSIENSTEWGPTATIKITIYLTEPPSGSYYFKIVLPNGISDSDIYSTSIGAPWKISLLQLYASPS
jgi:archaeal flagellar protein FlaG